MKAVFAIALLALAASAQARDGSWDKHEEVSKGGWSHGTWGVWTPIVVSKSVIVESCDADMSKACCGTDIVSASICKWKDLIFAHGTILGHWQNPNTHQTCKCPGKVRAAVVAPSTWVPSTWGWSNWGWSNWGKHD